MTDQDPPIEPLRRLDPAEPDEQGLGRLERLDPEAEDGPKAAAATATGAVPPKAGSRLRDGLTAAVTLAALLSLSSIAAIGGLVAVSMRSAPRGEIGAVAPMEAGVPLPTIRVGESAQGAPEKSDRDRPDPVPQDDDSAEEFTPVAPSPVDEGGDSGGGNGGGGGDQEGAGSGGGEQGAGGAWCDARAGGACDATTPGSVLGPGTEPEDGYVGEEEDEVDDDDDEDDDQGSDSGSSGSSSSGSGHSGKGH